MKTENILPIDERKENSPPSNTTAITFLARPGEIPSIKLSPEQIEEIHADEYSLMLFYATRIEPLSIEQIKRRFPEPEAKKAQSVLDRYVGCGLIHKTTEGKYFSNFPIDCYLNYADYRYDAMLETKKDQKVFEVMKEHASDKSYWLDRIYFSIDSFFSKEQSEELHRMFAEIRKKAKQFSADNRGKSVDKLRFRRLKFYDMFFAAAFCLLMSFGFTKSAQAAPASFLTMKDAIKCNRISQNQPMMMLTGGNDPGNRARAFEASQDEECPPQEIQFINTEDPSDRSTSKQNKIEVPTGGHDPGGGTTEGLPGRMHPVGGHDPGGGTTSARTGIGQEAANVQPAQCDWSKYENLLSYPAEAVCARVKEIGIEESCLSDLKASCEALEK